MFQRKQKNDILRHLDCGLKLNCDDLPKMDFNLTNLYCRLSVKKGFLTVDFVYTVVLNRGFPAKAFETYVEFFSLRFCYQL